MIQLLSLVISSISKASTVQQIFERLKDVQMNYCSKLLFLADISRVLFFFPLWCLQKVDALSLLCVKVVFQIPGYLWIHTSSTSWVVDFLDFNTWKRSNCFLGWFSFSAFDWHKVMTHADSSLKVSFITLPQWVKMLWNMFSKGAKSGYQNVNKQLSCKTHSGIMHSVSFHLKLTNKIHLHVTPFRSVPHIWMFKKKKPLFYLCPNVTVHYYKQNAKGHSWLNSYQLWTF